MQRVSAGQARILVVTNAGRGSWQADQYGLWVHSGVFSEIYSSQDAAFGGYENVHSNAGREVVAHDGRIWISIPPSCTLMFKQIR